MSEVNARTHEKQLLCKLLLGPEKNFPLAMQAKLTTEDFSTEKNRDIFEALQQMYHTREQSFSIGPGKVRTVIADYGIMKVEEILKSRGKLDRDYLFRLECTWLDHELTVIDHIHSLRKWKQQPVGV